MISRNIEQKAVRKIALRRRIGFMLAALLVWALAPAGLAVTLSPLVFSFLSGQGTPKAYVQEDAAGLVKTNLGSIQKDHVDITILEAAYDGQELRVVYSVRDKSATRLYTKEDEPLVYGAAQKDSMNVICDWVEINGVGEMIADWDTNPGTENGEILFYLQSLMKEQEVMPEGDFTVGLPLAKDLSGEWPRSVVPPELLFTLDAREALKLVRTAEPSEASVNGVHFAVTEGIFTPVAGAIRLDVSGDEPAKLRKEAYEWGLNARFYNPEGMEIGEAPESSFAHPDGIEAPPAYILMRIVPPETWPSEMILAMPGTDGKPDASRRIVIKLKEE